MAGEGSHAEVIQCMLTTAALAKTRILGGNTSMEV